MQFLDPTNPNPNAHKGASTVSELKGKKLAFLNNGWLSMGKIGSHIEGPLKSEHGVAQITYFSVPRNTAPPDGLLERIASEFDAAIVGMAN
jgi:hypothetical protein